MHKISDSASEHALMARKYRQRRQTQGKFASVNDFAYPMSMRESDKENTSSEINKSNMQSRLVDKDGSVCEESNIYQFSVARLSSAINLVDKTLVDCCMVRNLAQLSFECLGTLVLTSNQN